MILGAFGDSFLFGSDLIDCGNDFIQQPSNLTWPSLSAKKLNIDYFCYAVPGIGNKIIADDVLRAIYTHKNNMLYVINWTWIDRFDYININQTHELWQTIRPTFDTTLSKQYYKHYHSELNDKISNLMYITNVLNLLLKFNCKFIMTYMDYLLFDSKWHASTSVQLMQSECNNYLQLFEQYNFLDWSKKQNFPVSEKWHPMEQAHLAASKLWLPVYKQLLE
jgi:hypothetical protein